MSLSQGNQAGRIGMGVNRNGKLCTQYHSIQHAFIRLESEIATQRALRLDLSFRVKNVIDNAAASGRSHT
jgi:hypothetical protein